MRHDQGLSFPNDDSDLVPVYACIDQFFREAQDSKRHLSDLWAQLKAPPFGLKDGPVPVLLAHYLLLHDNQVGLYEDGCFVPGVDTAVIERLAKNPETFYCKSFALDGLRKIYVQKLLKALDIECPMDTTLLYAVKQLLRQVRRWSNHERHTQRMSPQAKALRKACLAAKEPDQLLFIDLPKAVGVENLTKDALDGVVEAITRAMQEVSGRFTTLLNELQVNIGHMLNALGPSVRSDLAPRAARLKDQILDPRLRAFVLALADQDLLEDADWIQRVCLALLGRAPSEWIDADVQRFHVALNELAPVFRRLEALHFIQQGDGQTGFTAVRLGLTTSEGADHQQLISVPEDQAPALQSFVNRLVTEASQTFGEKGALLVLAHLAKQTMEDENGAFDEIAQRRRAHGHEEMRNRG
jgi:hypothetical protein